MRTNQFLCLRAEEGIDTDDEGRGSAEDLEEFPWQDGNVGEAERQKQEQRQTGRDISITETDHLILPLPGNGECTKKDEAMCHTGSAPNLYWCR